jgi:hypothetical protein
MKCLKNKLMREPPKNHPTSSNIGHFFMEKLMVCHRGATTTRVCGMLPSQSFARVTLECVDGWMFIRGSWDMGSNIDIINIYNDKKNNNKTWLRRPWRCGAFSAFQSDDSTAFFHHHARCHSPTLLCFVQSLAN